MDTCVLSSAYLPPVDFFVQIVTHKKTLVEKHETYTKQTYRNRCNILGANGIIPLSIPVTKPYGNRTITSDIRISYAEDWHRNHWKSIESAYNSSPFFEFFIDDLLPFFTKKFDFLFDFNQELTTTLLDCIDFSAEISYTTDFQKSYNNIADFRNSFSPKKKNNKIFKPYHQVFTEKYGFIPNLSFIDLLFNTGSETIDYLLEHGSPENDLQL